MLQTTSALRQSSCCSQRQARSRLELASRSAHSAGYTYLEPCRNIVLLQHCFVMFLKVAIDSLRSVMMYPDVTLENKIVVQLPLDEGECLRRET